MRAKWHDTSAVISVGFLAAGYTIAYRIGLISADAARVFSDVACWTVPLVAGAACLYVSRRHERRMRLGWRFLGAAALSWGIGDLVWTYYEVIAHTEPFPSIADIGYLAAVPLGAGAMICFAEISRRSIFVTLLDAALIGLSVLLLAWAILLRALFQESSGTVLEQVLSLSYPIGDVVIIALVAFVWARASIRDRSPVMLIGAAIASLAVADFGYAYLAAHDKYVSGHPIDLGWIGGYVLIGVASLRARKAEHASAPHENRLRVFLPYVVASAGLGVTVISIVRDGFGPVRVWGLVLLLLVVVARQFLLVNEQQSLTIEQLRSVNEMKNGILYAVSHDLRTPLAVIEGAAEMLDEDGFELEPSVQRDLIKRVVRNSKRLEGLLTGLLDLDRLTRGILEPKRSPTDITMLIKSVAHDVDAKDHRIDVVARPLVANVDRAQVERIVENLFVNAVRHTPAGTTVWAEASKTPEGVLITVDDSGEGIPEEIWFDIFQPFVQSQESMDAGRGTGIGLALVAKFAELHGGRAWVERGRTGGARFQVLLGDAPVPEGASIAA